MDRWKILIAPLWCVVRVSWIVGRFSLPPNCHSNDQSDKTFTCCVWCVLVCGCACVCARVLCLCICENACHEYT